MKIYKNIPSKFSPNNFFKQNSEFLYLGNVSKLLDQLPNKRIFDLVVTSPPYNIGKEYEEAKNINEYFANQKTIIKKIDGFVKTKGSICWQVGNYIDKKSKSIYPLDFGFHEIFADLGYKLKNRIIWRFGHGMHAKKRLSGRYETILWYVKNENYTFNLDAIRIPAKYPGKKYYKGPKKGKISSNPLGKNPEDVWDIPNVKGNHIEKTIHPCQFPIGLIERLVLGMSNKGDLIFDPFMGVGSAGVAALAHKRKFLGAEIDEKYIHEAKKRISDFKKGNLEYRSHLKPIFDYRLSTLSSLNYVDDQHDQSQQTEIAFKE